MKSRIFIYLFVLLLPLVFYGKTNKVDISVLYVGFNPEKKMPEKENIAWTSQERFAEEYKTRMPAFVAYLKKYFKIVKSVDAREYTADMSNNFDVTIFDEEIKPIKERVREFDPETKKIIKYEPAKYLPDDYDRPSVFIGHPANALGRNLGSKLDWYCLCLDRHAHHIKTDHEIFKGPFKVDISLKNRPTPSPIFHYFDGLDMPAEIPMWEANTEGYHDGKGYRIGMVARGWGFEDSPDAEIISSGECDKAKTAVAIGRHGNFFLWGFAGSPDYMTEEAKQVFANAIVYTHKHANDKRIAKKYNDRIATKVYIDELIYYTTKRSHDSHVELYKDYNKAMLEEQKTIREKQERGEELTEREKMMLSFEPQATLTREQYLKKNIGRHVWSKITGLDTLAVRKYLNENRDYFYSEPDGFYDLKVDEDCKSLGIVNTDIKILDAAISLLEKEQDVAKAKRLLWRYTLEDFSNAKEWRDWFEKYKEKMFFTQAGGYVWLINDADANPDIHPRKDKMEEVEEKSEVEAELKPELKLDVPTDDEPVSVGAIVLPSNEKNKRTILIKAEILDGYHIYAYVPQGEAYIKTDFGIELPEGVELLGEWVKSSPTAYPGKEGLLIYENEVVFKHELKITAGFAKGSKIKCWVYYQCCDATICFPPKRKEFVLSL